MCFKVKIHFIMLFRGWKGVLFLGINIIWMLKILIRSRKCLCGFGLILIKDNRDFKEILIWSINLIVIFFGCLLTGLRKLIFSNRWALNWFLFILIENVGIGFFFLITAEYKVWRFLDSCFEWTWHWEIEWFLGYVSSAFTDLNLWKIYLKLWYYSIIEAIIIKVVLILVCFLLIKVQSLIIFDCIVRIFHEIFLKL